MNRENVQKLMDHLKALPDPENFGMDCWVSHNAGKGFAVTQPALNDCGTSACIMGHAVLLAAAAAGKSYHHMISERYQEEHQKCTNAHILIGAEWLDMELRDARMLAYAQVPSEYGGSFDEISDEFITVKDAYKVLRHYRDHNEVDWTITNAYDNWCEDAYQRHQEHLTEG